MLKSRFYPPVDESSGEWKCDINSCKEKFLTLRELKQHKQKTHSH